MQKIFTYVLSDNAFANFIKKYPSIARISIYIDALFLPLFPFIVFSACDVFTYMYIWFTFNLICFYLLIVSSIT